jgi:predicted RecB family nuclease
MASEYVLSKKTVLAGLQCHRRLWWELHDPASAELRESLAMQHRLREGRAAGDLARSYVPGGHLVDRGARSVAALLAETRAALARSDLPAVYEGAFLANDTLVFTDILERHGSEWTLIEVKSATSVSEREHVPDLAVQACVLRANGVRVARYEVMHLNRECRHPDLSNLFVRHDVTEQVRAAMADLDLEIVQQLRVAIEADAPRVPTGEHCSTPRACPFTERCWPTLPPHHVSELYNIRRKTAASFVTAGWETIPDLPDSVKLSAIAARQRRSVRQGTLVVEHDELVAALATLERPTAHLDFETIQPAIPRWPGCRPFDQIPVQLSCHIVDEQGGERHVEWLFDGQGDPRSAAARAILDACHGARVVTAYSSSFEKGCIRLVADACPEHAGELRAVADRIVDLLPIVREHVYHPAFGGTFSLKRVLPALVPELSYEGLAVAEGETAQVQLARLILEPDAMTAGERAEVREALLRYCELDTRAMVALEARLRELVRRP